MLTDITERLANGGRLSPSDAEALWSNTDLLSLGMAATDIRQKRHGDRVTFVRVVELPVSGPPPGSGIPPTAGELRVTGAPRDLEQAISFVRSVVSVAESRPVSGFSLADLEVLAERNDASTSVPERRLLEVLEQLRAAGLELVAEAPLDGLRDAATALDAVRRAGVTVARMTIHTIDEHDRVSQISDVVRLQDEAGIIKAFAPLARATSAIHPSTGYDDVKGVALARLVVDNIDSIQVDWALYGAKLAQVALTFGADDLDGVSPLDTLEQGARRSPLEEVRRNIRAAAAVPVERNGRFQILPS